MKSYKALIHDIHTYHSCIAFIQRIHPAKCWSLGEQSYALPNRKCLQRIRFFTKQKDLKLMQFAANANVRIQNKQGIKAKCLMHGIFNYLLKALTTLSYIGFPVQLPWTRVCIAKLSLVVCLIFHSIICASIYVWFQTKFQKKATSRLLLKLEVCKMKFIQIYFYTL